MYKNDKTGDKNKLRNSSLTPKNATSKNKINNNIENYHSVNSINSLNSEKSSKNKKLLSTSTKRACIILNEIYQLIDKTKLNPILETFKNNEMLKEFYMKRVFEILKEYIDNEKEKYIESLLFELNNLQSINENLKQSLENESEQKNSFMKKFETESKQNQVLLNKVSILAQELNMINERHSFLQTDFQNFRLLNDKILDENDLLKTKIKILDDTIVMRQNENNEIYSYYRQIDIEKQNKEEEVQIFKENFEAMKQKQMNIENMMDNLAKENIMLKNSFREKNEFVDELLNKIDDLKQEHSNKTKDYEVEIISLNQRNLDLQNQIDNVLKIKIKALKNKLREKLSLLSRFSN